MTRFYSKYETEFVKTVMGHSQQAVINGLNNRQRESNALMMRGKEPDGLFERMYEDNVNGKISDERFRLMTKWYEDEQRKILERIKGHKAELKKSSSQSMTMDMFIATVRKYTCAVPESSRRVCSTNWLSELKYTMLKKVNGVQVQKIRIHYNRVGCIKIPDVMPLPEPDVCIQTRKSKCSYSNFKCYKNTRHNGYSCHCNIKRACQR